MIPVVTNKFPIPTSGDTRLPNKNWKKPSIAEAHPEFVLSKSRASEVVGGIIVPKHKASNTNIPSTTIKDNSIINAAAVKTLSNRKTFVIIDNTFCSFRKKETSTLPIIIQKAFAPKHRLQPILSVPLLQKAHG